MDETRSTTDSSLPTGKGETIMREALRVISNPIGHLQRYARIKAHDAIGESAQETQ